MYDILKSFFIENHLQPAGVYAAATTTACIILMCLALTVVMFQIITPLAMRAAKRIRFMWGADILTKSVFRMSSILVGGIALHLLARIWLSVPEVSSWKTFLKTVAQLWMIFAGTGLIFAILDGWERVYERYRFAKQIPIRVFVQIAKLIVFLSALIMTISALLNRSPALLVSGLGAMTAILMLVFKDPILGFVAGIQLSANKMLSVGDWLEMPKYDADGDVIEITLTTVKVRNWDKTITTIPTYALISEAFKNWRGMSEAGGRRIKRSIYLDMSSIHFLTPPEITNLKKLRLISDYLEKKQQDIDKENGEKCVDQEVPANGRRLTNIGTLRAYLSNYLQQNPKIRQDMTLMVRQLQPTPQGIPLEIYAFTCETAWAVYEGIQADIFDHIMAIIPEFGLRIFQTPSGADLLAISQKCH